MIKLLLAFILLFSFSLGIADVGNRSIRWDEAFSVWVAQMPIDVGTTFTANDVHPPVYYWLLHIWLRLTGISEFSLRALSVFAALITTSMVYAITLRISKRANAAYIAIVLIALSSFHIRWSQDIRMYAVSTMFVSLFVYAYLRGWTRLLIIAGIGASLSHYFAAIPIVIVVLHRLVHWRECCRGRRRWIFAIATIGVVWLVWAAFAFGKIRSDPGFAEFDVFFPYKVMAEVYAVGSSTHVGDYDLTKLLITAVFCIGLVAGIQKNRRASSLISFACVVPPLLLALHFGAYDLTVLLFAAIFCFGLVASFQDNRRASSLIILGCVVPPLFLALLSLPFVPVHVNSIQERYFVLFAPFVFAGFGIGLAALISRPRLRLLGITMCFALVIFDGVLIAKRLDARYFKDHYRSMMAAVAALTSAEDRVFFTSGGRKPVVYFYLDRAGYQVPRNVFAEPLNVTGIPRRSDDVAAMMQWVFAGISRFWLVEIEAHLDEPLGARTDWINEHYHRIHHMPVGHNGISLYSSDEDDEVPKIDDVIRPVVDEARPGDQIRIGVPAGKRVDLVHSGQTVDTRLSDTWTLHQFDIYPFYFNGHYELKVADERYPFTITHSQDFPGVAATEVEE